MSKLQKEKAVKRSIWAAILTSFGFLVVLGSILYSINELKSLEQKKARLEEDIAQKRSQLEELKEEIKKADSEYEDMYRQFENIVNQIELKEFELAKKEATETIKPRVYIHSSRSLDFIKQISLLLNQNGYVALNEERVTTNKIQEAQVLYCQVRYFKDTEEKEADEILEMLKRNFDINESELINLSEFGNTKAIRPRYYEVWIDGITADNVATKSTIRDGYWDWTVFIEAPDYILDQIKSVEYTLHQTFPDPIRTINSRGSGQYAFALTTSGWGVFQIRIRIHLKNGHSLKLKHNLSFSEGIL